MTNHNEDTQTEPVNRPTRGRIALEAVFTAAMLTVLVWLVVRLPEEPRWYDWAGVFAYTLITGWFVGTTAAMVKRYRAPRPFVIYSDCNGTVWRDLGTTYGQDYVSNETAGTYPREYVECQFGPLTPATAAPSPITAYKDRDGDVWRVRPDGTVALSSPGPSATLESVERDYGPLTPIRD